MSPRILLVEDEEKLLMTLSALLEESGYAVTAVRSGEEALEALQHQPFDVVLSDIRLGVVSGIGVLSAARALPQPPEVVLLTGFGSMETAIEAVRAGAYDYLLKPCRPAQLLECLSGAVERHQVAQQRNTFFQMVAQGIAQLQEPVRPAARQEQQEPQGQRYTQIGELTIDHFSRSITFQEQHETLTPIEYELLRCLADAGGRVVSYQEIVVATHHLQADSDEAQQLVKPHVLRLRRKLDPTYLMNVRGVGYRLVDPEVNE